MSAQLDKDQFTGLILLTGLDSPGITATLFETLAPFSLTVVDIEQVVIRERLILTLLITCDPVHAKAIDSDLVALATQLDVDIATSFSSTPIALAFAIAAAAIARASANSSLSDCFIGG